MKILYALSNREDGKLSLVRFLEASKHLNLNIKIAAFDKSTPEDIPIDWNLEPLKGLFGFDRLPFESENFETYLRQVKYFNPDLIISDLELFTSQIAITLNKTIWQVSPMLLHYATPRKEKMAIQFLKSYPWFFSEAPILKRIKETIASSNKNFVYSHFGDINSFTIEPGFEWVRPYHIVGKKSIPCQHNIVAVSYRNDKNIINYIKKYKDAVLFSTFQDERYNDVVLKNIYDSNEYACNLKNSEITLNRGYGNFIADSFYNEKNCLIIPDYQDQESVMNSLYAQHFNLGIILTHQEVVGEVSAIKPRYNKNVKYLHEHLEMLL